MLGGWLLSWVWHGYRHFSLDSNPLAINNIFNNGHLRQSWFISRVNTVSYLLNELVLMSASYLVHRYQMCMVLSRLRVRLQELSMRNTRLARDLLLLLLHCQSMLLIQSELMLNLLLKLELCLLFDCLRVTQRYLNFAWVTALIVIMLGHYRVSWVLHVLLGDH